MPSRVVRRNNDVSSGKCVSHALGVNNSKHVRIIFASLYLKRAINMIEMESDTITFHDGAIRWSCL